MEQLFFAGKAYLKINSLVKTPLREFMAVESSGLWAPRIRAIRHLHISHNIMHLICRPKFCPTFVSHFSWIPGYYSRPKRHWKQWLCKFLSFLVRGEGGGGGKGANKVHYGKCGSGVMQKIVQEDDVYRGEWAMRRRSKKKTPHKFHSWGQESSVRKL